MFFRLFMYLFSMTEHVEKFYATEDTDRFKLGRNE